MPADYRANGVVTSRSGSLNKILLPPSRNGPSTSDTEDQSSTYSSLNRRNLRPPAYTFILPNLDKFPDDFRQFIERDIIEISTLRRLEQSGHLNWWCGQNPSQRLWPEPSKSLQQAIFEHLSKIQTSTPPRPLGKNFFLITKGDGNCLLHAASLGIFGVHDSSLNLRQLLHEALTVSERRSAFYRRWRWHESKANLKSELILSEDEWKSEWGNLLSLSKSTPRVVNGESGSNATNEQIYESLELIHIYVLANILKRPIIVVSDNILRSANGDPLSPVPFGGIYLPLELNPTQCHRSPLVLCFDASHFSALVAMKQLNTNCLQVVPIVERNSRNLLPIQFAVDPGSQFNWWKDAQDQKVANELDGQQTDDKHLELICKYMDVVKMDLRRVKKTTPVGSEFASSVPKNLLSLGSESNNNGHASRIFTEIRQHFRWLSNKRSKRKHNRPLFSAAELRQSNCVLTVLLHNFPHQYIDSMLESYIAGAKERFERSKVASPSAAAITPKKNRISRSFSSSSVLLTCLNTHCNKIASPSTNFLCQMCFEDQKREMMSIGSSSTNASPNSMNSQKENNSTAKTSQDFSPIRNECSKSSTMPALSQVGNNRAYYNGAHHYDEPPIRYADESTTSASSTMSSRNGAQRYISPTLTRYFYENDCDDGEPTLISTRMYRTSYDYDPPPMAYSSSPPYRHYSTSPVVNGRIQSPIYYPTTNSLPRVSLTSYRNHEYGQRAPDHQPTSTYPTNLAAPNVSCVKTCSVGNGIKNKSPSNGISFYYAAS
ncbi:OTU domain-containing protein [Aphelenchoides bicaudatus]|nr:OTU domain-containing protein [Aphelenchoides bicaudatus]